MLQEHQWGPLLALYMQWGIPLMKWKRLLVLKSLNAGIPGRLRKDMFIISRKTYLRLSFLILNLQLKIQFI
jgi:hypothetical protein